MTDYRITCCSTADLPEEFFRAKGVQYACFHVQIGGQDFPDDLGRSISFQQFYEKISAGAAPTTSQVNVEEYVALFEPILQQGQDILHLTLSSGISGTYTSACIARDDLLERYPERKLYIVDSLGASSGYGLLVDTACAKRDSGMPLDELYQWLEQNKLCLHHWFFSTDLSSYIRGGRISKTSGMVGTLLGICPLLNMDQKGHLIPRKKIRGKKQVMQEMVKMMEQHAEGGLQYSGKCLLSESACLEDARAVADMIETRFPRLDGKVQINSIGTVIGAHTGPGTVALFFWGDTRAD